MIRHTKHCFITLSLSPTVFAFPLAEWNGGNAPEFISPYLQSQVSGTIDTFSGRTGYVTRANETGGSPSSSDIDTTFSFTVTGLASGDAIDFHDVRFDYVRTGLTDSNPRFEIYMKVNNGAYGNAIFSFDNDGSSPNGSFPQFAPFTARIENGDTITLGFSFSDIHGSSDRAHMIDDLVLSGTFNIASRLGVDLDNNGVNDLWEFQFNAADLVVDEATRNADFDGDGLSNIEEARAGTNPRDFFSRLTLDIGRTQSTAVQVDFGAAGGSHGVTMAGGTVWNAVEPGSSGANLSGVSTANGLLDSTGNPSAVAISTAWSTQSGVDFSRAWDLHPGDRDGDYQGIRGDNPGVFNSTTISGLVPNGSYDLTVWTQAPTDFRVNGGADVEVIGSTNQSPVNAAASFTFSDLAADENGEVVLDWGHISSNRGANQWASITALSITEVPVSASDQISDFRLEFSTVAGKGYTLLGSDTLTDVPWNEEAFLTGNGGAFIMPVDPTQGPGAYFYRLAVNDVDADDDRLTGAEEAFVSSFSDGDPFSNDGSISDYDRLASILRSQLESEVIIGTPNGSTMYEDEPAGLPVTITRTSAGNNDFLNLQFRRTFQITDTTRVASNAASANDYRIMDGNGNEIVDGVITLAEGETSETIYLQAIDDDVIESDEQLTLTVDGESSMNIWISDAEIIPADDFQYISQAGHFLSQASMGGTPQTIAALANEIKAKGLILACEEWIDDQMALPRESSVTNDCLDHQTRFLGEGSTIPSINIQNFELVWWGKMIETDEQLRHRVAFSLSQVFVTSSAFWANSERNNLWTSYTRYYDKLADAAFGNHRDLLQTISYDPFMGVYLSSAQNRKANPATGTSPDENYAREVMQLFSCGVFTQNQNGVYLEDGNGNRLENYDNDDITEMARVFTGLGLSDQNNNLENFDNPRIDHGNQYHYPMRMVQEHHDEGAKTLLDGTIIPATVNNNRDGDDDISDALDVLAAHPSTAPHLSRLLIKRFTNSNPSNAYIGRVTQAWRGQGPYGNGDVGNFVSIVKAILLDPEARGALTFEVSANGVSSARPTPNQSDGNSTDGRLKEPIIKWLQFYRFGQALALGDNSVPSQVPLTRQASNDQTPGFGQIPMRAPSVFNYYDSEHSPATGSLAQAEEDYQIDLTSPESQILPPFVIRQFEDFHDVVDDNDPDITFGYLSNLFVTEFNYIEYLYQKNESVADFIDDVNLWFCNGQISPTLRSELITIANARGGANQENFAAILSIIFNSSDFSVAF